MTSPLQNLVLSILRQYSNYPAVLDAILQWTDNLTFWQEGMSLGDTYPYIFENLKFRYPEKVASLAFERMKSEVSKLMTLANFNVQRVIDNVRDNSGLILPIMTNEIVGRLDKLNSSEKIALYSFLLLKDGESRFATNVQEDPTEKEEFQRLFAVMRAAAPQVGEKRFINLLQETGIMNRLLNIGKTNRFLVYVASLAARKSLPEILRKLGTPTTIDASELIEKARMEGSLDPAVLSLLIENKEMVVHAPNVSIPEALKGVVGSYKGFVALSPLASVSKVETVRVSEPVVEAERLFQIEIFAKDSSGHPLGFVDVRVASGSEKTDSTGHLTLKLYGVHQMTLEKSGFHKKALSVECYDNSSIEVRLEPTAATPGTIFVGHKAVLGTLQPDSPTLGIDPVDEFLHLSRGEISPITLILGASTARSFLVRRIIQEDRSSRFLILDWKGEYLNLERSGFKVLSLKNSSELLTFNLFDSSLESSVGREVKLVFSSAILAEYFAQENRPLSEGQVSLLGRAIEKALGKGTPQTMDDFVNLLEGTSDEARKLGVLVKKAIGVSRFYSPQPKFEVEQLAGQNVVIDISGKGLHIQPRQSERLLLSCVLLKKFADHAKDEFRTVIVEEALGYPKTEVFKREFESIIKNLAGKSLVIGIARECAIDLNAASLFLHRGAAGRILQRYEGALKDRSMIESILDKLPDEYAVVLSKSYAGLVRLAQAGDR